MSIKGIKNRLRYVLTGKYPNIVNTHISIPKFNFDKNTVLRTEIVRTPKPVKDAVIVVPEKNFVIKTSSIVYLGISLDQLKINIGIVGRPVAPIVFDSVEEAQRVYTNLVHSLYGDRIFVGTTSELEKSFAGQNVLYT